MLHAQEYEKNILLHLEKVNTVNQTPRFKELQKWQSDRLLNTHMNLYQQDRFKPAITFFKDELYCAEHFQQRNQQIIKALPLMCKTMPESLLIIIEKAAQLHSLSLELDTLLLHYIPNKQNINHLNMEQWISAYKRSSAPIDRSNQIDLIEFLGNELARVVNKPMVGSLLSMSRIPAKLAGYQDIHTFVNNGFHAFAHLEKPQEFLVPVISTERALSKTWLE